MDARPRGKIARLPGEIRQALNERLLDGEPQSTVLAWLNTRPEVRARLATDFAGRPITKQNLSEWYAGGYTHWFAHRQLLDGAQQIVENTAQVPPDLADELALLLAARLALAAKKAQTTADPATKAKLIFQLCRSVARLRRAEHTRQRVAIERQKAAAATGDFDEVIQARFWQWMEDPAHREKAYGKQLTPLEKRAEVRRTFGLDPLPADHPDNDDINDPLGPDDIPMSFWQDVLEAEPVPDQVLGLDLIPPLVPPDHQFASELEQREAEAIRCRRVDAVRWAKWMALARRREAGLPTPKLPPPTIKRKVAKASNQARNRNCDSSPAKVDPCLPRGASSEAGAADPPKIQNNPETLGPQTFAAKEAASPTDEVFMEAGASFHAPYPDIDRLPSVYNCEPYVPLPPTFTIRRGDLDKLSYLNPPDPNPESTPSG